MKKILNIIKNNLIILLTILFFVYQEIVFIVFGKIGFQNILLKIIFDTQIALILVLLCTFFKPMANKVIHFILALFISIINSIYFVYYKTFGAVLSIYSFSKGISILQFGTSILNVLLNNWYVIVLFILPIIFYLIFIKKIEIEKIKLKGKIVLFSVFIILYVISILVINFENNTDIYSKKNLYYNINSSRENLKTFGIFTTIRLDLKRTLTKFEEKRLYLFEDDEGNKKVINKDEYNITEIDFEELSKKQSDETLKEISKYIATQEPTNKNEYTGIFEGKNLIVIVGESFSSLAIREDLTPTLYKIANEGFKFKNFYTPLFPVSTADGEYLTDTSLLPAEGVWSIEKLSGKTMPYSYGNVFKAQGYKTFAYHNYTYDYYKRDEYFSAMGYDTYLGNGNGLEERMDFTDHPTSDYEMVNATIGDYINEDKFVAYYITMSGHMDYGMENSMVQKNWDKVKNLPYSDKAKGYLATQIEFDKAVEKIVTKLENAGKLDDTVILISGDHYPYGLTEDEIKELSPYNMDGYLNYTFEKFHMPLIIYNGNTIQNVEVEKYASSLDILPTMLNLFGVEYDSRLLMGKDIFSDSEQFVIFSDRSFITEKGKYDSLTNTFTSFNSEKVNEEYIKKIKNKIYLKYRISRLILESDYYSSIDVFND